MYHYQKNIGDYRSATMHLSLVEHGVYNQLLDWYYLDEQPLPLDNRTLLRRLSAASEIEQQAVEDVLNEMFQKTETGWTHRRVDREIAQYKAKSQQAREAGKLGGRPPKKGVGLENNRDGFEEQPTAKPTANRKPLTDNQLNTESKDSVVGKPTIPATPFQSIVDLYHEVLPELDGVRVLNADRKKKAASLWQWVMTSKRSDETRRAETAEQGMDFMREYFTRARNSDWIMGRDAKSDGWKGDFDYLLSRKGLVRVVEKTQS